MIKANELKIGNYIHFTFVNKIVSVSGINIFETTEGFRYKISVKNNPNLYCESERCFRAIPLTEKWLKDFGFHQSMALNNYWSENDAMDIVVNEFGINYAIPLDNEGAFECISIIEYVHELQNLYFALTGEELTLKN